MHILPNIPAWIIEVEMAGKKYDVTMDGGGAWVPANLGNHMIAQGLARKGDASEPKPRWEALTGGGWGDALPLYGLWVKEKQT